MNIDNESKKESQPTKDTNQVKLRNGYIDRLRKKENRRSLPLLGQDERGGNGYHSDSFEDMMRQNAPFTSSKRSPKPRQKGHHRRHNKHEPLSLQKSYSDEDIEAMRTRLVRDISKWNYVDPQQKNKVSHIEHKHGESACHMMTNGFDYLEDKSEPSSKSATSSSAKDNSTKSRDSIFSNGSPTNISCDELTLPLIQYFENMCALNHNQVTNDINSKFLELITLIEERKKQLIEEATNIYDRKIASLNELKMKCKIENGTNSSTDAKLPAEHVHNYSPKIRSKVSENDERNALEVNGISEPWRRSSGKRNKDYISIKPSKTTEETNSYPEETQCILDEGNMTFSFSEDDKNYVNTLGKIREDLSSPRYSFIKGSPEGIVLAGDVVNIQVHTRNIHNEDSYNIQDNIEIRIKDPNKEEVAFKTLPFGTEKVKGCVPGTNGSSSSSGSNGQKFHSFSFSPLKFGEYKIEVRLNGLEITSSPYACHVHHVTSLTFDQNKCRRNSPPAENDSVAKQSESKDWIVQKGYKSSILRSISETPCSIYGTESVDDQSAWKIRLTSACADIAFDVGVATHTGVSQIDEKFTCHFSMEEFNKQTHHDRSDRSLKRRDSTFTLLPITFSVLLNGNCLRVTSQELKLDKDVEVESTIGKNFRLYPFCSLVHHHNKMFYDVCPMPSITFL